MAIAQVVDDDDVVTPGSVQPANDVAADESRAAGYD
jgi:hypothetical protein